MRASEWQDIRAVLAVPSEGRFDHGEVAGLPEPVGRYFRASIEPGTPLIGSVELAMSGRIRIGRWIPFRAREVLAPHRGFVWAARAAGVVAGSDRYVDGVGAMAWKAFGVVPVMAASGADISRSAAERAASEAVWVPTALLPRFGVTWTASEPDRIEAEFAIDDHPVRLTITLTGDGLPASVRLGRWGDPDDTGAYGVWPFGADFTTHATFGGITVPATGSVGWHHGTDQWMEGEFFRFAIGRLVAVDANPTSG